jgi:hypothetical protein
MGETLARPTQSLRKTIDEAHAVSPAEASLAVLFSS